MIVYGHIISFFIRISEDSKNYGQHFWKKPIYVKMKNWKNVLKIQNESGMIVYGQILYVILGVGVNYTFLMRSSNIGRDTFISCTYVLGTQIKRNFSISRIFQQLHPKKLTRCKYTPIRSKYIFLLFFA